MSIEDDEVEIVDLKPARSNKTPVSDDDEVKVILSRRVGDDLDLKRLIKGYKLHIKLPKKYKNIPLPLIMTGDDKHPYEITLDLDFFKFPKISPDERARINQMLAIEDYDPEETIVMSNVMWQTCLPESWSLTQNGFQMMS